MKPKGQKIVSGMDDLFKRLDAAKLAPASLLKSDAQKEHYESLVMFAYRKYQAARYHRERVADLLQARQKETDERFAGPMIPDENTSAVKIAFSSTANEFTHELSAFFAAMRSAVDFLAKVCVLHLKGAQADSISNFLKWIGQGKTGPILNVVAKRTQWLEHLREYRDYVVHRLVFGTRAGGQREWKDGKWHHTPYPVVVPSKTPTHTPDTRRARALADDPDALFEVATFQSTATSAGGSKLLSEYKVKVTPIKGYLKIENLMDRELKDFEGFFIDILSTLNKLDFQQAAIVSAQA